VHNIVSPVCPLCGSPSRRAFTLPDRVVYECAWRSCTLRFADPQPSVQQLSAYYQQYYYGDGNPAYENSPESALRQIIAALERQVGPLEGKRVLDFGCGVGTLCRLMLEKGAQDVHAIEPDPNARASVSRELGMCVVADVEELRRRAPARTYDLITMVDVVEHLRAPVQTLGELRSLLAPGGTLFNETPDANSLKARLVGERWDNYRNPTHLYYFNCRSLEYALRVAGYPQTLTWRPTITYQFHGRARRLAQAGLQRLGLDGALRVLARTSLTPVSDRSIRSSPPGDPT
jgi:2-polyprenyl-3-methyl-5-hydroxy-6-metoxy-1,4-benzoquinol methylase